MPWRGPAGAPATATRGRLFRFGKREGKALGVPAQRKQRRSGAQEQRSGSPTTAPSHGATPTGDVTASRAPTRLLRKAQRRLSKRARVRRSPGKERGESASGSAQKRRALRSAKRGKERVRQPSRLSSPLPIVTRTGRDYRPGPRQRIERVARRAAHHQTSGRKSSRGMA